MCCCLHGQPCLSGSKPQLSAQSSAPLCVLDRGPDVPALSKPGMARRSSRAAPARAATTSAASPTAAPKRLSSATTTRAPSPAQSTRCAWGGSAGGRAGGPCVSCHGVRRKQQQQCVRADRAHLTTHRAWPPPDQHTQGHTGAQIRGRLPRLLLRTTAPSHPRLP